MRDVRNISGRRFPELAHFDSAEVARFAYTDAWRCTLSSVGRSRLMLLYLLAFFPIASRVVPVVGWRMGLPPSMAIVVAGLFYGCGISLALRWGLRDPVRRHLRRWLVQFGVPICIPCGYDLRGQVEPRCPECGEAFDPSLLRSGASDGDQAPA